jgi:hypothetical protein
MEASSSEALSLTVAAVSGHELPACPVLFVLYLDLGALKK